MADYVDKRLKEMGISVSKPVLAATSIIFGVMVILLPSLLVWTVGLFLVIYGAVLLADYYERQKPIAVIATPSDSVYCRNCGEKNTKTAAYCNKCGKELVQTGLTVTTQTQEVTQQPQAES